MQTVNSSVEREEFEDMSLPELRLAHWLPQVYFVPLNVCSHRENFIWHSKEKQKSIKKCLFLLLPFHKYFSRCSISLDILFFLIVFVPMIENGSWSMTFEEVSFFF